MLQEARLALVPQLASIPVGAEGLHLLLLEPVLEDASSS